MKLIILLYLNTKCLKLTNKKSYIIKLLPQNKKKTKLFCAIRKLCTIKFFNASQKRKHTSLKTFCL